MPTKKTEFKLLDPWTWSRKWQIIAGSLTVVFFMFLIHLMEVNQFKGSQKKYDCLTLGTVTGASSVRGLSHGRYGTNETHFGVEVHYYYYVDETEYYGSVKIPGKKVKDYDHLSNVRLPVQYKCDQPDKSKLNLSY